MNKYILFSNGKHRLKNFLKDGFEHCYAAHYENSVWTFLDPTKTEVEVKTVVTTDFLPEYLIQEGACVTYVQSFNETFKRQKMPIINCVGFCKYFVGISDMKIITPFQLYKHLIILENEYGRRLRDGKCIR